MSVTKLAIGGLLVALLAVFLFFVYNFFLDKMTAETTGPESTTASTTPSNISLKTELYSNQTTTEQKIEAIKNLKEISLDETRDNLVRVDAGEAVVVSFFNFGAALSEGFSDKPFDEREIYDYAKYINTLGPSGRNSLLIAYIGLRFYSDEMDKTIVAELLRNYQEHVLTKGPYNGCSTPSKFSSVLYLAQKSDHTDVSSEFGDYYSSFEKAFEDCKDPGSKLLVGFMWLAAISDIGTTEKEATKAQELLTYITRDTSDNSALVENLRYSYFSPVQEPDTVEIVARLNEKYPEFKAFIETIR